jgi:hypothetical protein
MNPVSVLGGYPVSDLRLCSRESWSFHTYSVFDMLRRMAHRCCIIETVSESNDFDRHTAGIRRLISVLGDSHRPMLPEKLELSESASLDRCEFRKPSRRIFQRGEADGPRDHDQVAVEGNANHAEHTCRSLLELLGNRSALEFAGIRSSSFVADSRSIG